jgi:hypothetical protein
VPHPLVVSDSIAGRAHAVAPQFACSTSDGGHHAAWVHVAGELDVSRAAVGGDQSAKEVRRP